MQQPSSLEDRVKALEEEVAALKDRLGTASVDLPGRRITR